MRLQKVIFTDIEDRSLMTEYRKIKELSSVVHAP